MVVFILLTKDDEWQLAPDGSQSVEQEGSYDAANIRQNGTNGHSQVPVGGKSFKFNLLTGANLRLMPKQIKQNHFSSRTSNINMSCINSFSIAP